MNVLLLVPAVAVILASTCVPAMAQDIFHTCTFETLPSVVFHYPEDPTVERTVRIGDRAAVPFTEGEGRDRVVAARLGAYTFSFLPTVHSLTARLTDHPDKSVTETGRCVSVNRPVVADKLSIEALDDVQTPSGPMPDDTGAWRIREDRSSFDDSQSVFLSVDASETLPGKYSGQPVTPTLHLRCKENTSSLFIVAGGHFLSDIQGYGRVDYRIDDRQAGRWDMAVSTDNEALGFWSGRKAIPAIKRLFDGRAVVIRLTPFNESQMEFSFPIKDVEFAAAPLRKACNW